jgi:hypothetical protein
MIVVEFVMEEENKSVVGSHGIFELSSIVRNQEHRWEKDFIGCNENGWWRRYVWCIDQEAMVETNDDGDDIFGSDLFHSPLRLHTPKFHAYSANSSKNRHLEKKVLGGKKEQEAMYQKKQDKEQHLHMLYQIKEHTKIAKKHCFLQCKL